MSVLLDEPPGLCVKHVLGCGPNTTPSLCHSVMLDAMQDGGRWFLWVCLVKGGDGAGGIPDLIGHVNHMFPHLLVIPILLRNLVHLYAKLVSSPTMCIIVP